MKFAVKLLGLCTGTFRLPCLSFCDSSFEPVDLAQVLVADSAVHRGFQFKFFDKFELGLCFLKIFLQLLEASLLFSFFQL